ncbi:MAG: hypothetical protein QW212_00850 [Nitrososphaerales archaeon]
MRPSLNAKRNVALDSKQSILERGLMHPRCSTNYRLWLLGLLPILVFIALKEPIYSDEYVFYKLAQSFPEYSSQSAWIKEFHPSDYNTLPEEYWQNGYDLPIWSHPPLGVVIAKLSHLSVRYLKVLSAATFIISLYLVTSNLWGVALPMLLPIAVIGATFHYHDTYMILFLALTIYLAKRNSKWMYASASLLALTKLPAIAFLVPLAMYKTWKLLLPGLALVPYIIATYVVSGDPLYLFHHWSSVGAYVSNLFWIKSILRNPLPYLGTSGIWLTLPLCIYLYVRYRKPYILAMGLISILLAGYVGSFYQTTQSIVCFTALTGILSEPTSDP